MTVWAPSADEPTNRINLDGHKKSYPNGNNGIIQKVGSFWNLITRDPGDKVELEFHSDFLFSSMEILTNISVHPQTLKDFDSFFIQLWKCRQ